jgi:hypothetical protein
MALPLSHEMGEGSYGSAGIAGIAGIGPIGPFDEWTHMKVG